MRLLSCSGVRFFGTSPTPPLRGDPGQARRRVAHLLGGLHLLGVLRGLRLPVAGERPGALLRVVLGPRCGARTGAGTTLGGPRVTRGRMSVRLSHVSHLSHVRCVLWMLSLNNCLWLCCAGCALLCCVWRACDWCLCRHIWAPPFCRVRCCLVCLLVGWLTVLVPLLLLRGGGMRRSAIKGTIGSPVLRRVQVHRLHLLGGVRGWRQAAPGGGGKKHLSGMGKTFRLVDKTHKICTNALALPRSNTTTKSTDAPVSVCHGKYSSITRE